ncbi:MAG: VWA domain-containing protein, partial [Myxococcales bacterium]|nr:VWA domain-containing protein [Myxococcales bacterium]
LDDSMSMRVAGAEGQGTRLDRAREAALELVAGLQEGDAVAVVLAGTPPRVALAATTNLEAARAAIEETTQSDRGTDLEGAVDLAGELLGDLQHVDKRVVVLSDLADGGDGPLPAPEGIRLWVPLEELRGARRDCGVIFAERTADRVLVRVACGPGPEGAGEEQDKRRIAIRAGEQTLVEAPFRLAVGVDDLTLRLPDGWVSDHETTALYAVLVQDQDAIAVDDAAPVVAIGGQLQVGVVSDTATSVVATGGPPAVEQAFRALALGVQLRPLSAVPDREGELSALGLLIVDDVPGLTPSQRRELADWVTAGGVVLFTLGPGAAAAPLGSSFEPMLPALVRWSTQAPKGLDLAKDQFFGEAAGGMDDLAARGRAELDMEQDASPKRLAAWADGASFLLENRMGRGVVYVSTLPFDTELSDLALRPGFLHLLRRLVDTARTLGGVARTPVGAAWSVEGYDEVSVQYLPQKGAPEPVRLPDGPQRRVEVGRAGLYELVLDGNRTTRVASVAEEEVDLTPRPVVAAAGEEALGGVTASVDVSAHVAVFLLLLLFVELGLRAFAPRGARDTGPASSGPASTGSPSSAPPSSLRPSAPPAVGSGDRSAASR